MSTIYTFHRECASLATPAVGDRILTADVSAGDKNDLTITVWGAAAQGAATTEVIGFYGETGVDQGTMTATCLTALTTNPTWSASNSGAGVFGFASSTVAAAYVTRIQQMQVDIETLMNRIDSTGLVSIAGVP